jgi:putative transposase
MKRGPYAKVGVRNHDLLTAIRRIKADHPFWGYRRVWAYLRYVEQQTDTQKRVYRLMKLHDLLVQPHLRLKASRGTQCRKPKPTAPNRW